jgi:superfamily II DNA or RNA helicase
LLIKVDFARLSDSEFRSIEEFGLSQLTAWSPFFQSKAKMRGRSLLNANKVTRLEPEDGELVRAQVDGDGMITVSVRQEERKAVIECDSPQAEEGVFCEHIWATLLHLVNEPDGPGAGLHEIMKLKPQPPKARKREGEARSSRNGNEPMWAGRLTMLRPSSADVQDQATSVFPVQRQVCYAVLPRVSQRHNGLVIELRQRVATGTGWGKPKPLKVSADVVNTLTDPRDREICALLLGGTWVTEHEASDTWTMTRTHAMYRVPPQAQVPLLQQMIATRRCYVDDPEQEDQKLRAIQWDEGAQGDGPWSLYLHAVYEEDGLVHLDGEVEGEVPKQEAEPSAPAATDTEPGRKSEAELDALREAMLDGFDGFDDFDEEQGEQDALEKNKSQDLLIDLQMRRGGRRVPIESPKLVLGGPNGVVIHDGRASRFDDREAWRWVSQFREGRYIDDETERSVMRVEADQVEKFLDRLYLLPHLPDLDLPEGLGRAEQSIQPVPHLDLFSPTSAPAVELAPSTAKTNVVARLWFSYGEQRVSPIAPGRFVPVAKVGEESSGEQNSEVVEEQVDPPVEAGSAEAEASAAEEVETNNAEEIGEAVFDEDGFLADGAHLIRRNRRAEREAINTCISLGLRHINTPSGDTMLLSSKMMPMVSSELLSRGWAVLADQQLIRTAGPPSLSITSGIDWFELRGNVEYTGEDGQQHQVALPEILAAARAGRNMITLGDGSQGLLPTQWLEDHGLLTAMGEMQGDHLRFRSSQAAMLDALLDDKELVEVDDRYAKMRERLRGFDGIHPLDPADQFGGTLRPYQSHGLGWLAFLRRFAMGGILADDMGLGKTVQVLAMIQARKLGDKRHLEQWDGDNEQAESNGEANVQATEAPGPSIIVVPRSVVFNWVDEAQKFSPDLRVLPYAGPDRDQHHGNFDKYDLIVTSYGLMRRDVDKLSETKFDYAVLDEAQAIKNPQSQSAKAARLLQANHRLALTGTPIENHLGDLWSIFEYLNPGMLGSSARFAELIRAATGGRGVTRRADRLPIAAPVELDADSLDAELAAEQSVGGDDEKSQADALVQVASAIRPFILRRTKQQVLTDLPAKTEQTIICEMEPEQRRVYDQLKAYYRGNLLNQLDATAPGSGPEGQAKSGKGLGQATFMVLEALLRLRQAACHPALIDKTAAVQIDRDNAPSAKLDELDQRLDEIIDEGSKALVFSQFTSMLALIRKRLDQRGIKYAYLDGQTRNRKDVVQRFQTDPDLPVFLISLKAGGVGLNLTAAEYVFIMDPWWNPAVEAQAIDRTHRIGQKKPVFAYRLICEDTVEQRILELQSRKRDLADAIVGGEGNVLSNLTRDDLEQLLS